MVLAVHENDVNTNAIFWTSDNYDRGQLNANELLVISFNRVLYALEAYSTQQDDPLALSDALENDFFRTWRSRPDITKQILAHGLQDVGLVWSDSSAAKGKLTVSLIWDVQGSDDSSDPLGEPVRSSFTVSLPGVQGAS